MGAVPPPAPLPGQTVSQQLRTQTALSTCRISLDWLASFDSLYIRVASVQIPKRKHQFPLFIYWCVTWLQKRTWRVPLLHVRVAVVTWFGIATQQPSLLITYSDSQPTCHNIEAKNKTKQNKMYTLKIFADVRGQQWRQ
jgi:hypothetical protein